MTGRTPPRPTRDGAVPIVGIGASAGGIEALAELFDAMPPDSGAAFVVVLHLDPTRQSQLSSILARHSSMRVVEIQDRMQLEINHVYVIAPNSDLTIEGTTLRLAEPAQPRGRRHPVDVLFACLAGQRRERAVGIILSGTGTNGTRGLREIKAAGGMMLVQDPATARFDGMPRSAIGAGLADHVLPAGEMPAMLLRYLRHGYVAAPDGLAASPASQAPAYDQLLALLRGHSTGRLRSYKPATLLRRINRRMSLRNLSDLGGYVALLRADPDEAAALARDLLISVTGFFRDAPAWAALDALVVARLRAEPKAGETMRIWVSACATGEEAYSIAMLLLEHASSSRTRFDLKIFASDLQEHNLGVARAGVYPGASVELLSQQRVCRFFDRLDGSYQVKKELRDLIVFARHDVLCDPPFSRMDLITCRNMLIYIEPDVQEQILALFHFALRDGGGLFLGSAETIGRSARSFETVSKKWRIYRKSGQTHRDVAHFSLLDGNPAGTQPEQAMAALGLPGRAIDIARRVLLDRFVPASVLVNRSGRILYFHGETAEFLNQPTGEPTRDLLAMVRQGLLASMRAALHAVIAERRSIEFSARVGDRDALRSVHVTLGPLAPSQFGADLFLVTFESGEPAPAGRMREAGAGREAAPALEDELRLARTELQSTIEQFESVNEELKASSEEALSMNEELQSTNEELETSKEELQSFNEELHSVNSQLQHKIGELEEVGNDLFNLLSGTEIATLFLDTQFRIKWFSPATEQLFDLAASDIGRPITHFARKFADDGLLADATSVLATLTPIEVEIAGEHGRWFLRRLLPYRTRDDRIIGLVITFVDLTERKRSEAAGALLTLNKELELRVAERTREIETANHQLVEQITARRRIEEELNFLAHHDRLTGLPNRRLFGNLLPALLAEAELTGKRLAVLYLDLDRFKAVNDMLGHQAGDTLLQVTAQRLTSFLRHTDIVARLGGDEFVAVLAQLDGRHDAAAMAGRIVETLSEAIEIDGQEVQVGISIGITIAPVDGSEAERLLQNADMALYRAKSEGGNTWKFFEADMAAQRTLRQTVEADLRRALAHQEFELLYQPMIELGSRRIAGFEALLRWRHRDQGLLLPASFIRTAEETGLIVPIGEWVIQQACRDAGSWPQDVRLAVNLSGVQIRHRALCSMITTTLAQTGFSAGRLELEVTESVLLEDNAATLETLHHLRRLGLGIALDDFGTGYSSLSHLGSFPYSKIKIDLSFVRMLGHDEDALVIVRAILALGDGLRMIVTAEGVETAEQLEILRQLGCAQVQGYLLGHPIPANAAATLLAQGSLPL